MGEFGVEELFVVLSAVPKGRWGRLTYTMPEDLG